MNVANTKKRKMAYRLALRKEFWNTQKSILRYFVYKQNNEGSSMWVWPLFKWRHNDFDVNDYMEAEIDNIENDKSQ